MHPEIINLAEVPESQQNPALLSHSRVHWDPKTGYPDSDSRDLAIYVSEPIPQNICIDTVY